MITSTIRNQIDAIWNALWTGGISNPLEVIEQITYLLFLKRLDDLHKLEEKQIHPPQKADGAPGLPRRKRSQRPAV
jgi:type I restriction enzyme M protein